MEEAAAAATGVDLSRKFVSETELDENRKKRQEEWEKVRKPEDPEGKKNTCTYTQMDPKPTKMFKYRQLCIHPHVCLFTHQRLLRRSMTHVLSLSDCRSKKTKNKRSLRSNSNSVSHFYRYICCCLRVY